METTVKDAPGTEAWCAKLRRRARQLATALNRGELELAEILWQVYDTPIGGDPNRGPVWRSWGYESFSQYAEEELGLKRRKAERLRQIWMHVEVRLEGRIDRRLKARLYNLGWTKVREIVPLLTPQNFEKWVTLAEDSSYAVLTAETKAFRERVEEARILREKKRLFGETEETDDYTEEEELLDRVALDPLALKMKVSTFGLMEEQHTTVEQALDQAARVTGSDKRSRNLSLICLDFMANTDLGKNLDKAHGKVAASRFVSKMEQTTGVKLVAIDPVTGDIVYGMDTLRKLAKAVV